MSGVGAGAFGRWYCILQDSEKLNDGIHAYIEKLTADLTHSISTEVYNVRNLIVFLYLRLGGVNPLTLSGGQKQRLSIVTALIQDRKIIILDEPTSGLDYDSIMGVSAAIKTAAKRGKIVLIISHDIEFINTVADNVFEL